jgi:hypothetical protein
MNFLRTLRAMLREIFDESAYERFCAREGLRPCRDSYARFLSEAGWHKERKVRCC